MVDRKSDSTEHNPANESPSLEDPLSPIRAPVYPGLPDCGSSGGWESVSALNGNALVWWNTTVPSDRFIAESHAFEIDHVIWPAFDRLGIRAPLSDVDEVCNGGDAAIDIYIRAYIENGASGRTDHSWPPTDADYPEAPNPRPTPRRPAASYIRLHPFASKYVLAHEFFHACLGAYRWGKGTPEDIKEYDWLYEATAYWAVDYAYPGAEWVRNLSPNYLAQPEVPLNQLDGVHEAGAYLYFFYLAGRNRANSELIPKIWEEAGNYAQSLDAVNAVRSFDKCWHEFARLNWNRPPVTDCPENYQNWEIDPQKKLTQAAEPLEVSMALNDNPDLLLQLPVGLEHLSSAYYHLTNFNGVHSLNYSGAPHPDPIRILALVKTAANGWREEDWTAEIGKKFCFDRPEERIEDLVLIVSNSSRVIDFPSDWYLEIFVSNMGCRDWTGTAYTTTRVVTSDEDYTITADATATFSFDPTESENCYDCVRLALQSGYVTWRASGASRGCAVSGEVAHSLTPGGTGKGGILTVHNWTPPYESQDHRRITGLAFDRQFLPTATCPGQSPKPCDWCPGQSCWLQTGSNAKLSDDGMFFRGSYQEAGPSEGAISTWGWDFHTAGGPYTIAALSPTPDSAGWNDGPTTASLTAVSENAVPEITYSATGAQTIADTTVLGSTTSIQITSEGKTTLSYSAKDDARHRESPNVLEVKIDKSPPSISMSTEVPPDANGWYTANVTVALAARDVLSGVAAITYSASGAQSIPSTTVAGCVPVLVRISAEGTTTLTATAVDRVGNVSEPQSMELNIAKPVRVDRPLDRSTGM